MPAVFFSLSRLSGSLAQARQRHKWVLIIPPKFPEISLKCQMEQSFNGKPVWKKWSTSRGTPEFPLETEFRKLLCHFTDSCVSRPNFTRNLVMREGNAWHPRFDNGTMVRAISSGWSVNLENRLVLCNSHPNRNFPANGKHPRMLHVFLAIGTSSLFPARALLCIAY